NTGVFLAIADLEEKEQTAHKCTAWAFSARTVPRISLPSPALPHTRRAKRDDSKVEFGFHFGGL
ncbi:hypothetical protein, partial [Serratia marcescens]|uniref:hypothetical protein n=1 Tax=Serratia marcescens TaxID=615 RepID=UPI001952C8A7